MHAISRLSCRRRVYQGLALVSALWCIFWYFCGPVVVLHYDARAQEPVVYFLNDNNWIFKKHIAPGASVRYRADMFPNADSWIDVSFPFASRDAVEFKPPFSRVDVYVSADTKIERTIIRRGFFDRFSSP